MKKNILALLFIGISMGLFSQLDRSIIPVAGEPKEINIQDSEVFTTENGITVILSENHKIPKVSVRFVAGSDSKVEGDKAGLSEMAGELIMSGTASRTKDELDNEIDFIGASVSSSGNSVSLRCLKKHLSTGLDLMTDVLFNANFPEDEVKRVKKQAESGLASVKSSPDAMAQNAMRKINFPDHPFSNILTEESLENLTRDDMIAYYKDVFTPIGSYLVVVGDISREETEKMVKDYFDSWTGKNPYVKKFPQTIPKNGNQVYFVEKKGAVQSVIYVTYPVDMGKENPDQINLKVLNNILGGGGFGNRLTQNLREDKGFTYGCRSSIALTDNGSWMSAGGNFRNEVTDSAITEILYELKTISNDLVSDEELSQTKSSSAGSFARSLERPATIANFALDIIKNKLPKGYYKSYLKNLNEVSKEDVLNMAQRHIQYENCNIIVVGNSEILESLLPFDSDNEIEFLDAFGNEKKEMLPSDLSGMEIINKYLLKVTNSTTMDEVRSKAKNVKSYKKNTELSMAAMPGKISLVEMYKAPKTQAMKMEMNGMIFQSGYFKGKKGYQHNMQTGKKQLTKEEISERRKSLGLFPELNYEKNNIKVEAIGIESKGTRKFYVVKTIDGENEGYNYYDASDFLQTKKTTIEKSTEGETTENSVEYADYKEIDGLLFPHAQNMSFGKMTFTGELTSIELNADIDFSEFKKK